jgi:hypothetical protein
MNWKKYFEMMIDWKKLPAYKAEPRIDSLIGYFLQDILEEYFEEKIETIIPELPIRLGTVRPELENTKYAERSYKVDFFAVGNNDTNYLVEFKTDTNSRRLKQDEYLINSKKLGTSKLINGILMNMSAELMRSYDNNGEERIKVNYIPKKPQREILGL